MIDKDFPNIENTSRWNYIKHLWMHEFTTLWFIPGMLMGLCIGFILGWLSYNGIVVRELQDFIENFLPEAAGIGITVTLLYYFDLWRSDKRQEKQLKSELLWQIHSRATDIAISAIDRLHLNNWLDLLKQEILDRVNWEGANLQNCDLNNTSMILANLSHANLTQVNLSYVSMDLINLSYAEIYKSNLSHVFLEGADLKNVVINESNLDNAYINETDLSNAIIDGTSFVNAIIYYSNFEKSKISRANLNKAIITGCNLVQTWMLAANLKEVVIEDTDLSGAIMFQANLENSEFICVKFDENTIFPDGTKWTPYIDITRFTNPNHPQYWRSDNPLSPAYHNNN